MKNLYLKGLSLLIAMILILGLTACEGIKPSITESIKSSETEVKEKPVLKIMTTMASSYQPSSELLTFKTWGEKVGAVIEPTVIPADSYRTKLVTVISSGDIPDILMARDMGDSIADIVDKYGPAGLFAKVDENWDKLPNLKKWYDKYPDADKITRSSDGHIYGMPVFYDFVNTDFGFEVRADLLKKGGVDYEKIEALDDVTNALRVLKEQNAGKAPLSFRDGYTSFVAKVGSYFGTSNFMWYEGETNKFTFSPLTDRYKIMVDTLASWYKEGLLHKDFATMQDQVLDQLYATTGDVTARIDNMGWDITKRIPGSEQKVIKTPKINGIRVGMPASGNVSYKLPWVISAKSKNLDTTFKAVDYSYTVEYNELQTIGVEGITYKKDESSSWGGSFLVKIYDFNTDNKDAKDYFEYGIANQQMTRVWLDKYGPLQSRLFKGETNVNFIKFLNDSGSIGKPIPQVKFTDSELETIQESSTKIITTVDEYTLKFILGTAALSDWNNFIEKLKAMNPEKVEEIYNNALKRYDETK